MEKLFPSEDAGMTGGACGAGRKCLEKSEEGVVRRSRKEKAESRERILVEASRLLRERGLEKVSVADVMDAAGMTHGGFYAHFPSKDALIAAALEHAFGEILARLASLEGAGAGQRRLREFTRVYLSLGHVESPGRGCPIAALGTEVAHGSSDVKEAMAKGIQQMIEALGQEMGMANPSARSAAIRLLSGMVGAVILARSTDSPEFRLELLEALQGGHQTDS